MNISSQNVNTLSLSKSNDEDMKMKLLACIGNDDDIIFIQDIRAKTEAKPGNFDRISNFLCNNNVNKYKLYLNSKGRTRGVAILMKDSINFSETYRYDDIFDNMILIEGNINGKLTLLGSIYGPNDDTTSSRNRFSANLEVISQRKNRYPDLRIVIGGDWNVIQCPLHLHNIDQSIDGNISNNKNQEILLDYMDKIGLCDPFRINFSDKPAYTWQSYRKTGVKKRLDFFLIDDNSCNNFNSCSISNGCISRLFDHNNIRLSMGKRTPKPDFVTLYNSTLDCPMGEFIFQFAYLEGFLNNITIDYPILKNLASNMHNLILREKFNSMNRLKTADFELNDNSDIINEFWGNNIPFPDADFFHSLECDNYEYVFEAVLSNIKNNLYNLQLFQERRHGFIERHLRQKLDEALLNRNETLADEIIAKAESYNRKILEKRIEHLSVYENLHNERVTPLFLRIQKGKTKDKKLETLCNDNGETFASKTDRYKFILDKFSKKYQKRKNISSVPAIMKYLSEIDKRVVKSRMLTKEEMESIEQELSITEMDNAVKQLNKNSAGGVDGFTQRFVNKFWNWLRLPLHRYFSICIEKGNLGPTLGVARCKLLEKKGDPTKFKNWRNISILSVFYKIFSKCIANRLNKYINKITGREQKAYKSSHICQELVLNVLEMMNEAKKMNDIPMCVLSIDFSSAFDFLSHNYINDILEFLNFGPFFRSLVEIDLKDRQGCVYNDDNKLVGLEQFRVV